MPKTTLGKLPREAIRMLELPRVAPEILEGFRNLVDLTGTLSDACDELGRRGNPRIHTAAGQPRQTYRRSRTNRAQYCSYHADS